jgi:hypothetical protein
MLNAIAAPLSIRTVTDCVDAETYCGRRAVLLLASAGTIIWMLSELWPLFPELGGVPAGGNEPESRPPQPARAIPAVAIAARTRILFTVIALDVCSVSFVRVNSDAGRVHLDVNRVRSRTVLIFSQQGACADYERPNGDGWSGADDAYTA